MELGVFLELQRQKKKQKNHNKNEEEKDSSFFKCISWEIIEAEHEQSFCYFHEK